MPVWAAPSLLMMGFCSLGIFTEAVAVKSVVATAVIVAVAGIAGARFYQEE